MPTNTTRLRQRTWEIVEVARPGDSASRIFDIAILVLIIVNVIAFSIESIPLVKTNYGRTLKLIELISITVFTIEYSLRVWACVEDPLYRHPVRGRLAFIRKPLLLIDLAAILPFFIYVLGIDLRYLRAIRLLRILRLGKLGRYYPSLKLIIDVVWKKKSELLLIAAIMVIITLVAGSLIYTLEHPLQPAKFSDIPTTIAWSLNALAKLNLGGIYPITPLGKTLFSVIGILGTLVFALPTAVIVAGFMEEWKTQKQADVVKCPHCGNEIEK